MILASANDPRAIMAYTPPTSASKQVYTPTAEQQYAEMREDTAIQRQAADMQAAGINPILMATNGWGGASSAASVSRIATTAAEKNANTKETKMILDFVKDLFNSAAKVLH